MLPFVVAIAAAQEPPAQEQTAEEPSAQEPLPQERPAPTRGESVDTPVHPGPGPHLTGYLQLWTVVPPWGPTST